MQKETPKINPAHAAMANAIRALAMDAVEAANSGHPGMPMGMADAATVLFSQFLKFNPAHPRWPDRDRFILSAGHGSMLLYALLHLTGYADMPMDELKRFRQLGSRTAGHPEYGFAAGIETTTGPLGQGFANAVGMALAERMLAAEFPSVTDHRTYVIAGDGCLMEGISHEAASLAGHLKLNRLIVLWDDNGISIDGKTALTISEDTRARFAAYGWDTCAIDGHNPQDIAAALTRAQTATKPTLIACRTLIGYGAPNKQGSEKTHGNPLGKDEIQATRTALSWPHAPFEIPDQSRTLWQQAGARGGTEYAQWQQHYEALPEAQKSAFERRVNGDLPESFAAALSAHKKALAEKKPNEATRKSSENTLEAFAPVMPELAGGSADLTGSNNTKTKAAAIVKPGDYAGRYIHYGVREHAMAAAMNGIALHGGFIPFGGTFLVFSDYMRPSIRLSALMHQRVIYVLTHDSIGLGEDGPTHQPVEHLAALRAIPNLQVFRPADATETAECWALALATKNAPSALALTRQNIPALRTEYTEENLSARGAYILRGEWQVASGEETVPATRHPSPVTLLATGSEVHLALQAQTLLAERGIAARVVSMPCWELFDTQPESYRREVLGSGLRVAIEAGIQMGWEKYIGEHGIFIGMHGFGASGPYEEVYRHFGITAEAVVEAVIHTKKAVK